MKKVTPPPPRAYWTVRLSDPTFNSRDGVYGTGETPLEAAAEALDELKEIEDGASDALTGVDRLRNLLSASMEVRS
jgi:hypothetical protein